MENKQLMPSNSFDAALGVIKAETFSSMYPNVNEYMMSNLKFNKSRNGFVVEMLDVKTQLTNPYRRCVGGYGRDINIFFLLAEAMWIAVGRKDVEFLSKFNANMNEFSDDGVVFHAPYGFRLRSWGVKSEDNFMSESLSAAKGYDQIIDAVRLLSENHNTRQVVASIWNPSLDLGCKSKDLPCNDMLMFKIRDGKLITTIQNRSNDLHWGLPTNIFQFSFLTELMAGALGVELGTQTHNSQSLHIYDWSKPAQIMKSCFEKKHYMANDSESGCMYEGYGAKEQRIDFNFDHEVPTNRFREIESVLKLILKNLTSIGEGGLPEDTEIERIANFSGYLFTVYQLLALYLEYKNDLDIYKNAGYSMDNLRREYIEKLTNSFSPALENWDILMLAKNFFYARLKGEKKHSYLGTL